MPVGQGGTVIRGETWKLGYAIETTYGTDPGTANYTNMFGVVQTATLPDPVIDFMPLWMLGNASKRNWYITYKGRIALAASIPDIWLLDGRPLRFPIGTVSTIGSSPPYTHTISEAFTLSSIALHATLYDSDGTVKLNRRFLGGKVGRASISGAENDFLKMSFDEVQFINLAHDQSGEPYYSATVADISPTYPTTEPYLFSYGSLSLAGTEFARIRNFRLDISNNLEPKYYITDNAIYQLPYEYREGRREYTLATTIDIEDASLFKELVRQGTYSSIYKGFQVIIQFTKSADDYIKLTIPSSTPSAGGDAMGCLIRTAPHNIMSTEAIVNVPLTIIGRALGIEVKDSLATYP